MEGEMTVDDLKSQNLEQQKLILQLKDMIREREQSLAEKTKENKVEPLCSDRLHVSVLALLWCLRCFLINIIHLYIVTYKA